MELIKAYVRRHRVLCAVQLAAIVLLAVVGIVYGKAWMFFPFLALTLFSWTGLPLAKWLLYIWCGVFLAAGAWSAQQYEFLAQMEPGDYSLALSLLLVLILLLATILGNSKKPKGPGSNLRRPG